MQELRTSCCQESPDSPPEQVWAEAVLLDPTSMEFSAGSMHFHTVFWVNCWSFFL
jgi:hypothetical protein